MIINALCNAYDRIAKNKDAQIARDGFSFYKINYYIIIDNEGNLKEIIDNTASSTLEKLPQNIKKNGVEGWLLYDSLEYCLGLEWCKEKRCFVESIGGKGTKKFNKFKEKNNFISKIPANECANIFYRFLNQWDPAKNLENEKLKFGIDNKTNEKVFVELKGLFAFCICDITNKTWENEAILTNIPNNDLSSEEGQCAITGKVSNIARIHNKIIGVYGTDKGSGTIASFKPDSFKSYNLEDAYNASVSEEVMQKYTAVLNYFLRKNSKNFSLLGKDTVVFWAECEDENYLSEVWDLLGISNTESKEEKLEKNIKSILTQIKEGINPFFTKDDTKFHILILSANTARISVRRYYNTTFGKFKNNILQHYLDMQINGGDEQTPIWQILDATVTSVITNQRKDSINPSFAGALAESIFNSYTYPDGMFAEMLLRIKTDNSAKEYLTKKRVSFIKAYLVRKDRKNKKEEIKVGLDKGNKDTAYNIGRIFAVLEKAQQDAIPNSNTTIRDRYFASACGTPANVLPSLLVNYQYHISKLDKGAIRYERLLQEIFSKIDESFPKQLSLEEQGRFIIGYYQQKTDLWTKQENIKTEEN